MWVEHTQLTVTVTVTRSFMCLQLYLHIHAHSRTHTHMQPHMLVTPLRHRARHLQGNYRGPWRNNTMQLPAECRQHLHSGAGPAYVGRLSAGSPVALIGELETSDPEMHRADKWHKFFRQYGSRRGV